MGRIPKDWDLCTNARPQEVARCFKIFDIIETGLKYGTLTVVIEKLPLEITTYRAEGTYLDNRRPKELGFIESLKGDLARRDFTMNALAYNPQTGYVDPYDGLRDISNHVVRCVGNPNKRLKEDSLRIMRALRFSSQLGFTLDKRLADSIHQNKAGLKKIAVERLASELNELLLGKEVRTVLLDYVDVLEMFIPEITPLVGFAQRSPYHQDDVWQHTVKSIAAIAPQQALRLAMLFHDIGKPLAHSVDKDGKSHFYGHEKLGAEIAGSVLKRMRYDNNTIDTVVELVRRHMLTIEVGSVAKWMNQLGKDTFEQLLEVKKADLATQPKAYRENRINHVGLLKKKMLEILEQQQCFQLKNLAINGNDLIMLGIEQGPLLGNILNELLERVIEKQLENDRKVLLLEAEKLWNAHKTD